MMLHWALSVATGTAILISSPGSASPPQGLISGSYILDEERSDDVSLALNSAVDGMSSSITRPSFARRLRKSIAVNRMRISIAGSRVGIAYDDKAPIVVWIGGDPVKWKLIEVLVFNVSAKANGEAISLTFRGDDSERITTYRSVGQDLVVDTTITGPLLSKPIVYKQIFNRTN